MPNTKSAIKALRQNVRRKVKNITRKDSYKKTIKEYRKLVAAKKLDEARVKLTSVFQSLDKAAKSGAIKKNKASRLKSRAAALVKSVQL